MERIIMASAGEGEPAQLSCHICSKKFHDRKPYLRHSSYCRRSSTLGSRSRKRACMKCTKAKTHCDATHPRCSRCAEKNILCVYEGTVESRVEANTPAESAVSSSGISSPSTLDIYTDAPSEDITPRLVIPDATSEQQWNTQYPYLEATGDIVTTYTANTGAAHPSPTPQTETPLPARGPTNTSTSGFLIYGHPSNLSHTYLIPPTARLFYPRKPSLNKPIPLSRRYIIQTLRSYPLMLDQRRSRRPPPFVHQACMVDVSGGDGGYRSFPGPLAVAEGIVGRWGAREGRTGAWGVVKREVERLGDECERYNASNKVAALQAITIYFLLRISESDEEVTSFDVPLVQTMIKIALQTKGIIQNSNKFPSWEKWILAESLRRTTTTLFLIHLLYNYHLALYPYQCDGTALSNMVLPCRDSLWSAGSAREWRDALRNDDFDFGFDTGDGGGMEGGRGALRYGDLLDLEGEGKENGDGKEERLDTWLASTDGLGALVVAVAGLGDGSNGLALGGK